MMFDYIKTFIKKMVDSQKTRVSGFKITKMVPVLDIEKSSPILCYSATISCTLHFDGYSLEIDSAEFILYFDYQRSYVINLDMGFPRDARDIKITLVNRNGITT